MKKTYFAPETTQTIVEIEGLLQNLSNNGDGTWSQGGVGDDDSSISAGNEDEGRAKGISVWD
ncbi:MAG: hypothetical protein IJL54_08690 [Prevotella sp.]|nr:hypothetical protein [Prevotella sp.]